LVLLNSFVAFLRILFIKLLPTVYSLQLSFRKSKVKVQFSSKMYFSSERAFTALSNHLAGHMWRMAVEMWRMAVEMWRMAVENVANVFFFLEFKVRVLWDKNKKYKFDLHFYVVKLGQGKF